MIQLGLDRRRLQVWCRPAPFRAARYRAQRRGRARGLRVREAVEVTAGASSNRDDRRDKSRSPSVSTGAISNSSPVAKSSGGVPTKIGPVPVEGGKTTAPSEGKAGNPGAVPAGGGGQDGGVVVLQETVERGEVPLPLPARTDPPCTWRKPKSPALGVAAADPPPASAPAVAGRRPGAAADAEEDEED